MKNLFLDNLMPCETNYPVLKPVKPIDFDTDDENDDDDEDDDPTCVVDPDDLLSL